MANRTLGMSEPLHQYLLDLLDEPPILRELREATAAMPEHEMQIAPEQGRMLQFMAQLIGARRCVEVGTFTGYSSLAVALVLPPDGEMICCDVSERYTDVARRYWEKAGVADRITLRIGPGSESLDALLKDGQQGRFDFAFIDADKVGYERYYEQCLELLRPGGLMLLDNAFQNGKVADPQKQDASARAIRAVNRKAMLEDDRVLAMLDPVGDGILTVLRR
jgi:caffeoyl-CoA O-methyltransferase